MTTGKLSIRLAALAALGLAASTASADTVFLGSSGDLSASANFALSSNQLTVTLTNTSSNDVTVSSELLTGVFFTIDGDVDLIKTGANLTAGSKVWSLQEGKAAKAATKYSPATPATPPTATDVTATMSAIGKEWAFNSITLFDNTYAGISSTGLGLFGPHDRFDTTGNLEGPDSPGGSQFGLLSAGDNLLTFNGGMASDSNHSFIQNSAQFHFTVPQGFSLDDISGVYFHYGTDLCDPTFPGRTPPPETVPIPLPPAAWAGGMLLTGAIAKRLRRARN